MLFLRLFLESERLRMAERDDVLESLENANSNNIILPKMMSVLPLKDNVIYPYMIFPILIGRTSSLKAVAEAVEKDKLIFVTAQKSSDIEDPQTKDIYSCGTIAKIIQILRLPNNLLKVLVEGVIHGKAKKMKKFHDHFVCEVEPVPFDFDETDKKTQANIRHASELFVQYIKQNKNLPSDLIPAFENIEDIQRKLYFAAANIQQKVEIKQKILEEKSIKKQFFILSSILLNEINLLKLEDEIDSKVQESVSKTQRKYYIQEQIRALQKELGDDEVLSPELESLKALLDKAQLPESVKSKIEEEFERLKKTPSMSPEYSVNRTYLELIAALPWSNLTSDNLNIKHVKDILDEDHFDLEKPKERILEYIAILNFTKTLKRQILCFVGPPGVGKTSLAKSIARALGRNFVRFSLGGIRDEAEIRGHRRTYIGALPGKIIQSMKKAGSLNPVILLDEIDKMSTDFRGDPSSALLEVLDPEQNVAFNDHYLEVDYDLSNVLFITTANVRYDIPLPLQDRMEIIELSSYLETDKLEIAKRHIIPKLLKEYGLDKIKIQFTDEALYKIIREYTKESGVRNLEREISSVLRKIAKEIIEDFIILKSKKSKKIIEISDSLYNHPDFIEYIDNKTFEIAPDDIERLLKAPRFKQKQEDLSDKIGVVNGLAWTSVGGEIMPIEVSINPGPEKLTLTGKLGDVMKESAIAALTNVKTNSKQFGISEGFYKKSEIHIHVPEGAIPKDGPSAGITMTVAIISAASGKPVRGDVAMTGEITLRGNILPIGGLNEKLLAAQKAGMTTVLVPYDNLRDIDDIKPEIKKGIKIIPVKHISEALPIVFKQQSSTKRKLANEKEA